MVNGVMANVFDLGSVFQLILDQQHIISNFQQIKEMLMVNGVMANVFDLGSVFQLILDQQHIISNFQLITDIPKVSTTSQCVCSPEVVCNAISQLPFDISFCPLKVAVRGAR
jgi:hypothetical protein